ncbi:hypothetical protein FB472_0020 [Rhodoglobus vestalii]|uniref:Nucleotidyltransferase AbiEii toxin of type IV toxin-antitoxin system n=1 Tax=Rhodoglobus vestalii TaxID=193384 RepID=A0A8H2PWP0_9MICO|nr:DUF6036 family nucleotidyltransferase [Rhodoglobus vestalii]TQO18504.1 hypothetical protein FB472_0020 [Rhodoglobus vestalii]
MSGEYRELNGDEIRELLGELLERLAARGVEVEVYIIGGAAMALHLGRQQLTPDVDGLFRPRDEVFAEATLMAEEKNLDPDWVNDRAVSFMAFDPAGDVEAKQIMLHGHPVTIASKRTLLAMKIAASRVKDHEDTSRLIVDLGITDAEEIVDLAFGVFGEDGMTLPNDRGEVRLMAEEAIRRANAYAARKEFLPDTPAQ